MLSCLLGGGVTGPFARCLFCGRTTFTAGSMAGSKRDFGRTSISCSRNCVVGEKLSSPSAFSRLFPKIPVVAASCLLCGSFQPEPFPNRCQICALPSFSGKCPYDCCCRPAHDVPGEKEQHDSSHRVAV